jgi:DNA polymerase-1
VTSLLPGWEHLAQPRSQAADPAQPDGGPGLPTLDRVATEQEATAFATTVTTNVITAIGVQVVSYCRRPSVSLRNGDTWMDVRSQEPACVALVARHGGSVDRVTGIAVDPRAGAGAKLFATAMAMPVQFVMHDAKPVLFALWALGLAAPQNLFDTAIAAACLNLGRHHVRARRQDPQHRIREEQNIRHDRALLLSLQGQCAHYRLGYPYASSNPDDLGDHLGSVGEPLATGVVRQAICAAQWSLHLCQAQQTDIQAVGLHHHLHTVEFPFTVANARIEWHGVPVSRPRLQQLAAGADRAADHYAKVLKGYGIHPPGSRDQFLAAMQQLGHTDTLLRDGQLSTEDNVLEPIEHLHPAIRAFRQHARYRRLASEQWISGALLGADGRIHPRHTQLGAATGRNSCSTPNLAGIGRVLRPIVVAPAGRALVELDYAQIEVGVAAAHNRDDALIAAFNSGDVYAAMAQTFYRDELTPSEASMPATMFKRHRPELRDRIKTFVLAVLYNIQPGRLAVRFGISVARATAERDRFLGLYPQLRAGLDADSRLGAARGYASIVSGLKRHVPAGATGTPWSRNLLRNTPIQGSAAVVFKKAVVLLDAEFAGTSTQIVLPVHDSVLIECDLQAVDAVCERAAVLMGHALRHYYPQLQPRIDVYKVDVTCWNKDGRSDSFDRFLANPDITIADCGIRLRLDHCAAPIAPGRAAMGAPFAKLMKLVGGVA